MIREARVKPEIELFDSGDIALCRDLISDGTLEVLILCSIVMGVKYGFQPSPETALYARGSCCQAGTVWTAFGTGRMAFPMVAQSYLAGGHVRVGLEDAVYLNKGVLPIQCRYGRERLAALSDPSGGQIATARKPVKCCRCRHDGKPPPLERVARVGVGVSFRADLCAADGRQQESPAKPELAEEVTQQAEPERYLQLRARSTSAPDRDPPSMHIALLRCSPPSLHHGPTSATRRR